MNFTDAATHKRIARSKGHVLHQNIVGTYLDCLISELDTRRGCSLPSDGNIRLGDLYIALQFDGTANIENYNPRPGGRDRRPERSRSAVIEIGYMDDFAAAAGRGIYPVTFRTWENLQ